jgi:hypothetical protein
MKQYLKNPPLCIAFLFALVFNVGIFAAPASSQEKGASASVKPDTVRIGNSFQEEAGETVIIPNSRESKGLETGVPERSGETCIAEKEKGRPVISTEEPLAAPVNGRVRHKGKIITGSALFGVSYGLSLYFASFIMSGDYVSSKDRELATYLCIPVAGPIFLYFSEQPPSDISAPIALLCAGWSFAQGMGIALFIKGMVGTDPLPRVSIPPLSIEPVVMMDKPGLGVRVRF